MFLYFNYLHPYLTKAVRDGSIQLCNGKIVVGRGLLVSRVDLTLRDSEEAFGRIAN